MNNNEPKFQKVAYCNRGGSLRDTLHIDDLRTSHPAYANHEARVAEDVKRIIAETGAKQVSFNFVGFPRFPVALDHPKLTYYINKLFRPARPAKTAAMVPTTPIDDANLLSIIDNR